MESESSSSGLCIPPLRGGGGGGSPCFFVKLDFEIAVDQQTKAHDQTFEGVPDSGCPRNSHALIWSIFGSTLPNHLKSKSKLHILYEYQLNIYLTVDSVAK